MLYPFLLSCAMFFHSGVVEHYKQFTNSSKKAQDEFMSRWNVIVKSYIVGGVIVLAYAYLSSVIQDFYPSNFSTLGALIVAYFGSWLDSLYVFLWHRFVHKSKSKFIQAVHKVHHDPDHCTQMYPLDAGHAHPVEVSAVMLGWAACTTVPQMIFGFHWQYALMAAFFKASHEISNHGKETAMGKFLCTIVPFATDNENHMSHHVKGSKIFSNTYNIWDKVKYFK